MQRQWSHPKAIRCSEGDGQSVPPREIVLSHSVLLSYHPSHFPSLLCPQTSFQHTVLGSQVKEWDTGEPHTKSSSCSDTAGPLLNHWQVKGTVGLVAASLLGSGSARQCPKCGAGCVHTVHCHSDTRPLGRRTEALASPDRRQPLCKPSPAPALVTSPCTELTHQESQKTRNS